MSQDQTQNPTWKAPFHLDRELVQLVAELDIIKDIDNVFQQFQARGGKLNDAPYLKGPVVVQIWTAIRDKILERQQRQPDWSEPTMPERAELVKMTNSVVRDWVNNPKDQDLALVVAQEVIRQRDEQWRQACR